MKCKYCGKTLVKDACYKEGKNKFCSELECIKWNTENKARQSLLAYIKGIYEMQGINQINWAMLTSQIKNMLDVNKDWNYSTIKYTLWYMCEIAHVNLFSDKAKGSVLSLIPFYLDEAKDYYIHGKSLVNQQIEDVSSHTNIHVTVQTHKKEIDL